MTGEEIRRDTRTIIQGETAMENNEKLKTMRDNAKMTVAGFVATATASCVIQIPVADAFILIGEQVVMMGAISAIYKLNLKKKTFQTLVLGAFGTSGASVVGKTIVSSAFKLIPGIGSVAGSVISASTAGVLTLALGNAFIELCEAVKRGDLSEDDIKHKKGKQQFLKYFKIQLNASKKEEGKKYPDDDSYVETDKTISERIDGEIDWSKISFSNIEGMDNYDSNCVNINYDGKLIGTVTFGMKNHQKGEKKAVLHAAIISKDYRGKHIFSYTIKQISNLYPVEISIKKFPENEGMARHLLSFENVLAGK